MRDSLSTSTIMPPFLMPLLCSLISVHHRYGVPGFAHMEVTWPALSHCTPLHPWQDVGCLPWLLPHTVHVADRATRASPASMGGSDTETLLQGGYGEKGFQLLPTVSRGEVNMTSLAKHKLFAVQKAQALEISDSGDKRGLPSRVANGHPSLQPLLLSECKETEFLR